MTRKTASPTAIVTAVALLSGGLQGRQDSRPGELRAGSTLSGLVQKPERAAGAVPGVRIPLIVDETADYAIQLRSHFFDCYLVLLDEAGAVLGEDDDGWFRTHARLARRLSGPRRYVVEVRAMRGGDGPFELGCVRARAGESAPAPIDAVEDARAAVRARTERLGRDHWRVGVALVELAAELHARGNHGDAAAAAERGVRHIVDARVADGSAHERAIELLAVRPALGEDLPDRVRDSLARLLESKTRYAEAELLYRQVLEHSERRQGPRHERTAAALNNLALVVKRQGRLAEAESLYRRAIDIHETAGGPALATCLDNLGSLLVEAGRLPDAEPYLLRACEIRKSTLSLDHPSIATSLNNLGRLYRRSARFAESERCFREALAIKESQLGRDDPRLATSLANLASVENDLGRLSEAEALLRRALVMDESHAGTDHADTAMTLSVLAAVIWERGNLEEAEQMFRRSLKIMQARLGETHQQTVVVMHNLARVLGARSQSSDAERLHRRALAIREAALEPDHPSVATSLGYLGYLLRTQSRAAEAEPLLERAAGILAQKLGAGHPHRGSALTSLAQIQWDLGKTAEAEATYRQVLRLREAARLDQLPEHAMVLTDLGALLFELGRLDEAEECVRRGLRIRTARQAADHVDVAGALALLATVRAAAGDATGAWDSAVEAFQVEMAAVHRLGLRASREERARVAVLAKRRVDQLFTLLRTFPDRLPRWREAFARYTQWKGIVFRQALRAAARRGGELTAEQSALASRLSDLASQLGRMAHQQVIHDAQVHERQFNDLRVEKRRFEIELAASLSIDLDTRGVSADELGRLLPGRHAFVDFVIHAPLSLGPEPDRKEDRLLALVVLSGADAPVVIDLGTASSVRAAVSRGFSRIVGAGRGRSVESRAGSVPSAAIWDVLWKPVHEALRDARRVFVSGDWLASQVPFEAIADPAGRYVLEDRDVVYVTDAVSLVSALGAGPAPHAGHETLVIVGGVDYGAAPSDASDASASRPDARRSWPPLGGTLGEANEIVALHARRPGNVVFLHGAEATEARLRTECPTASVMHLATHGFFASGGLHALWSSAANLAQPDQDPQSRPATSAYGLVDGRPPGLLSALVLAGPHAAVGDGGEDGLLTAAEVMAWDLTRCRLAVLSACETSLGSVHPGEGLMGLRRAFLEAGAGTVISSLWKVDDEATKELMIAFYRSLWESGLTAGQALREARLAVLRRNRERHGEARPETWGAFVLAGEWR